MPLICKATASTIKTESSIPCLTLVAKSKRNIFGQSQRFRVKAISVSPEKLNKKRLK